MCTVSVPVWSRRTSGSTDESRGTLIEAIDDAVTMVPVLCDDRLVPVEYSDAVPVLEVCVCRLLRVYLLAVCRLLRESLLAVCRLLRESLLANLTLLASALAAASMKLSDKSG
jgi:hypothetical protein